MSYVEQRAVKLSLHEMSGQKKADHVGMSNAEHWDQNAARLSMEHSGLLTILVRQLKNRSSERLVQPATFLNLSMIHRKKNKEARN